MTKQKLYVYIVTVSLFRYSIMHQLCIHQTCIDKPSLVLVGDHERRFCGILHDLIQISQWLLSHPKRYVLTEINKMYTTASISAADTREKVKTLILAIYYK